MECDGRSPKAQDGAALRICLVCSDYPPGPHGGIGTMTQLLARALAARGHHVRAVGVYPPAYPAADLENDQDVQVIRLRQPRHPFGWVLARWRLLRLIRRWIQRQEIDAVEVPDWQGWAAGWPSLPIPVIARLHGSAVYFAAELGRRAGALTRHLESSSLRRVDFVCSASRYTAERTVELFQLGIATPEVLYNPVEASRVPARPRARGRVVFTGTLTEKKGVVPLMRAWPQVLAHVPEAQLHLYGKDGSTTSHTSMRGYMTSLLPEAALASVRFHGHVARATAVGALAEAWVAVFPSYAEAFAVAPLEAMACGTPTVYTRRGSGPELIRDGQDGLLVEPDRPEEIAGALVRVLNDEVLANRLGAAGYGRVTEAFDLERLVTANVAFYRRCIAGHRQAMVTS
jgi:glycosyltransferase involved in cell wall biosynthesis